MPSSRPTHYTSSALFNDIKQGRIKIPQFQRDYVWERERAACLLDSILKGYPLGTFILWKTQERLRAVREIGGLDLPSPPEGEFTSQVLDGQQRLTSIVAAMEGLKVINSKKTEDFGEICVDLDADLRAEDRVVHASPATIPAGHVIITFRELLTAGINALCRKFPDDRHLELIQKHKDQFNAYQFPAVELTDAPLAVATEIFTRLNVGGRSLTLFEIMVAKTWDEARGFDLLERVRQINAELATVHYGGLDHQIHVQLVAALSHQNIRKTDILNMQRGEFIDAWPDAMRCLRQAVDFCRSDLHIPVRALLPSERILIPLAYYFHLAGNNPAGDAKRRLVDLVFRIGLSERYSGTTETRIAQDLKAVKEIHQQRQPVYDFGVSATAESIRKNGNFRAGRSYIKTLLCILSAQHPRCFLTGGEIILDNALLKQKNSRNYHHFFPRAYLSGRDNVLPVDHIANITLIGANLNKNLIRAKAPSRYIAEFQTSNPGIDRDLATHLIALAPLLADDYEAYFTARCEALAKDLQMRLVPQERDMGASDILPPGTEDDDSEDDDESEVEQMTSGA